MGYLDQWYKPSRMVLGVAGRIGDGLLERAQELLGDLEDAETGEPEPVAAYANGRVMVSHEAVRAGTRLPRRAQPAARPPRPLRDAAARDRARRRDVVAALHRGPRAARARLLRLRAEPQLHRRRDALHAGGRRHRPHRRRGVDDRRELRKIAAEPVPAGGAREGAQLREGSFRPPAREPAGADDVRPAARGARAAASRIPTR